LYEWRDRHPEFSQALSDAKDFEQAWWEIRLIHTWLKPKKALPAAKKAASLDTPPKALKKKAPAPTAHLLATRQREISISENCASVFTSMFQSVSLFASRTFKRPQGGSPAQLVARNRECQQIGLGAFGKLCDLRGDKAKGAEYLRLAKQFAQRWVKEADDGDHFRLAF
jgi:hypothetical protein